MNVWLTGALLLLAAMVPSIVVCLREGIMERIVALQMIQSIAVLALLLLAQGFGRGFYFDLAVVLAFLNIAGALAFIRLLERWL